MIVITLDKAGLAKVEIFTRDEAKRADYHKLFLTIRERLNDLNEFIKTLQDEGGECCLNHKMCNCTDEETQR